MGIETLALGALLPTLGSAAASAFPALGSAASGLGASLSGAIPALSGILGGPGAGALGGLSFPLNSLPLASTAAGLAPGAVAGSNFAALPGLASAAGAGSGASSFFGDLGRDFIRGQALGGLNQLVAPQQQQQQFIPPPAVDLGGGGQQSAQFSFPGGGELNPISARVMAALNRYG